MVALETESFFERERSCIEKSDKFFPYSTRLQRVAILEMTRLQKHSPLSLSNLDTLKS